MRIIKRSGSEEIFTRDKIFAAIAAARNEVTPPELTDDDINRITDKVVAECENLGHMPSVEEVQEIVETQLVLSDVPAPETVKLYIRYRYKHQEMRTQVELDDKIGALVECKSEEAKQENSNKNPVIISTQRDYMAGEASKGYSRRRLLPKEIIEEHDEGSIHMHDLDYFAQHSHNCDLVNLEDMFQNTTVISDTLIETPHRVLTAANIATQIVAQVASNQYGGQSITLTHLAPFVESSRKKIRTRILKRFKELGADPNTPIFDRMVEEDVRDEVRSAVQTIQYQVLTLLTSNGQTPFITTFMYLNEAKNEQEKRDLALLIEETLLQRLEGVKNKVGEWVSPSFPKLIYVLEEDNIAPGTPYYYLTELALRCSAKRMVPDYISEKKMLEYKVDANGEGHVYPCMGCRSFPTPYIDENGKPKYYGRFNQGVCTINLPYVALESGGDFDKFWEIFDRRLELCYRALMLRHERLEGTPSDVAPILWQYGALARLKSGEPIDKLLHNGYSTISLGYAGLYECVKYMTGKSHTDPNGGTEFGLKVMQYMNDKCKEWKTRHPIDFSLYGTPIESTTYKFAKSLQRRFGIIPGISDKGYITNSYHVHVTEEIDAFTKLSFEAQFQALSPGGAVSYVEVPNMEDNIPAMYAIVKHIYDNILYAEINTKSDYCQCCGYNGEIKIVEDNGKLVWRCPQCGNTDQTKMNVARRTCGYIGTQFWNQGRTEEIRDRVIHVSVDAPEPDNK